ncbi:MAG: hypothetical protein GY811_08560 [Myxococcales bacterium]|nr:hypothetical protein [Myxococcales bacterium]
MFCAEDGAELVDSEDELTGATDLYAVGAILYDALTGTMAFKGTTLFE